MSQHLTHHSLLSSKQCHVVVQKCHVKFLCTWAMSRLYHGFQCLFPFSISRNVQLSYFQNGLWFQHFPQGNNLHPIDQNWLILMLYLKKNALKTDFGKWFSIINDFNVWKKQGNGIFKIIVCRLERLYVILECTCILYIKNFNFIKTAWN